MSKVDYDVIVVGAGTSGMMAGIHDSVKLLLVFLYRTFYISLNPVSWIPYFNRLLWHRTSIDIQFVAARFRYEDGGHSFGFQ